MQQHPPEHNPFQPGQPGAQPPAPADFSDTIETASGGLKAKWQSFELPIQIGLVIGAVVVFGAFARYILPAMLAAMGAAAVIAVLFVPYWLPTIIAFFRGHPNKAVIALVNFFFGWTFIGWFICLFWALTNPVANGGQSVIVNVSNSAVAGGPPQYMAQPVVGYGQPQPAPPAMGQGPQYRVGDVVNGYRFDGTNWVPEPGPQQAPPPPPAQ